MKTRYALVAIAIMGLSGAGSAMAEEIPQPPPEHEAAGPGTDHHQERGHHPMMLPGGIVLSPEQEAKVSAILDKNAAKDHPRRDPKAMTELHRLLVGPVAPTADQIAKAKADALAAYGERLDAEIGRANERREIMAVLTPDQVRVVTERRQLQHLFGGLGHGGHHEPGRDDPRHPGGPDRTPPGYGPPGFENEPCITDESRPVP